MEAIPLAAAQRAKDRGGLGHHEAGKGQKLSDMPECYVAKASERVRERRRTSAQPARLVSVVRRS